MFSKILCVGIINFSKALFLISILFPFRPTSSTTPSPTTQRLLPPPTLQPKSVPHNQLSPRRRPPAPLPPETRQLPAVAQPHGSAQLQDLPRVNRQRADDTFNKLGEFRR